MIPKFDVAIVGAGIVGLAHAWMAARRGLQVAVFDRSPVAQGATVRNFGMIWPIGQPSGRLYDVALRSRELWLELDAAGVVKADRCGSVHLAHHADEMAVLEEFCAGGTHDCRILSADETRQLAPLANPSGLRGGLYSPTELRVDPRTAAAAIASWLETQGVTRLFATPIASVNEHILTAADGRQWQAERIIVCSGSDLQTLFPDVLATSGLKLCKLQMLRTVAQPPSVKQYAHLASGLTLRHYSSFQHCPSLQAVIQRVAADNPALDRYGVHVMATQTASGELILGDSHEYGAEIEPFDKAMIDELIIDELKKILCLPDWTIQERWHGIYAKHPQLPVFQAQPQPGVSIAVGPGGAGMTMSFGLADQSWKEWESYVVT